VKCRKAISEISNYLDGDLDEELRQTIQAHLDKCHHCHAVFDTTKRTIELYCDGKLFELPNEVRNRLHDALRRKLLPS
jgi:anti-sigma factor RsiW